MNCSGKIVSLWKMLSIGEPGNLLASFSALGALCKYLQLAKTEAIEKGVPGIQITKEQFEALIEPARLLRVTSIDLDMHVAKAAADQLYPVLKKIGESNDGGFNLNIELMDELLRALDYLLKSFRDEMDVRFLFLMNPSHIKFYAPSAPLFGDAVSAAFPSSVYDIDEAGKCRATSRWTACVLHLMRALEPCIIAFQKELKVRKPKINWQDILNQIDAQIKQNGNQEILLNKSKSRLAIRRKEILVLRF